MKMQLFWTFALTALTLTFPSAAFAQCTDFMRHAYENMGCTAAAVEQICAGQRPQPLTSKDCNDAPPGTGTSCQLSYGACELPNPQPLNGRCTCNSLQFGPVTGVVVNR
jgi:hypothetical protein